MKEFLVIKFYKVMNPVVDVINAIDRARGIIPRTDYLELVFSDAMCEHDVYNVSFGIYDKYFDNRQFVERVLPF